MERDVQKLICHHISRYYPDVIFLSDQSGLRVHLKQRRALKTLKSCRGIPDLIVLFPSCGFHGLAMEIKTDDAPIFRADGHLVGGDHGEHVREQYNVIMRLRSVGYAAFFVRGVDGGVSLVEKYMSGELQCDAFKRSDPSKEDSTTEWSGRLIFDINGLK